MIFRAVRSRCKALDTATQRLNQRRAERVDLLWNIERSASRVSSTSMISEGTCAVLSKASSSSARHASFFGLSTRFWAITGRLRSSNVTLWNRPSKWLRHLGEVQLVGPRHVLAHDLPKVSLPGGRS